MKGGVALLITNNVTYWREPQPASDYRAFSTYEGNTLRPGLLEWDKNTAASVLRKHPDFELGGTYPCHWTDTAITARTAKGREKAPFRYLLSVIVNEE